MTPQTRTGAFAASLLRPDVLSFKEYEPIVPLEVLSQRYGVPLERIIKLDGNENPYGPSQRVTEALAQFDGYHIYPDPEHREARRLLARYVGLDESHLILGNGSDELLNLVCRLVLTPGDEVIDCVPTFGMYRFYSELAGGRVLNINRTRAFKVPVDTLCQTITSRTKLIFLASPNNPTANTTPEEDIRRLLETGRLVVVDEAYYEFSGKTVASLVPRYDNLIVTRTLSKWAGLAGLRVGYGIFPLALAKQVWKIKDPYNVNAAAQIALRETFADLEYQLGTVKLLVEERERLAPALSAIPFLRVYPSEANFIFCEVQELDAAEVKEKLARQGIFIRHFNTPLLRNAIRISVGKLEHTTALITALKEIGKQYGR